jgi:hypothetical protein
VQRAHCQTDRETEHQHFVWVHVQQGVAREILGVHPQGWAPGVSGSLPDLPDSTQGLSLFTLTALPARDPPLFMGTISPSSMFRWSIPRRSRDQPPRSGTEPSKLEHEGAPARASFFSFKSLCSFFLFRRLNIRSNKCPGRTGRALSHDIKPHS